MGEFLRQDDRFLSAFSGLCRIAEIPQDVTPLASTAHARIMPSVKKSMRAVLLRIIENQAPLQVLKRQCELT